MIRKNAVDLSLESTMCKMIKKVFKCAKKHSNPFLVCQMVKSQGPSKLRHFLVIHTLTKEVDMSQRTKLHMTESSMFESTLRASLNTEAITQWFSALQLNMGEQNRRLCII